MYPNAAVIYVGAESHFVAVPADRDQQPVREFGAFTSDLYHLAKWLKTCGVETVAMESTGVYWIPLFQVLEERGLEVILVDPHRLRTVPGRKTDVVDCQWLQRLHAYGLLAAAFRPAQDIRELRSYLRQRSMLVEEASHHIQHMQKMLNQMNLELQHVVCDVTSKTALDIMQAIISGERQARELAKLRNYRVRASEATIAKTLQGQWQAENLFELMQAVQLYTVYQEKIADCDHQIGVLLHALDSRIDDPLPPKTQSQNKLAQHNAPSFDIQSELYRMTGVDLTSIDGIEAATALKLISEIGLDMNRWPTVKHFASWLGLCPGSKITGGKVKSSKTKPSANCAAAALRLAANSLHRSDSRALGAFLGRKKTQLGSPVAITATAHKLARLVYSMLKECMEYTDPGQVYYERQYRQRVMKNLTKRARHVGYQFVEPEPNEFQPTVALGIVT